MRRKSARFDGSVVVMNRRCIAASVCSLSQTSNPSQRSRKCWRCGFERKALAAQAHPAKFGQLVIKCQKGRKYCGFRRPDFANVQCLAELDQVKMRGAVKVVCRENSQPQSKSCAKCGDANAREYEQYFFSEVGVPAETGKIWLCLKCARAERRSIRAAQAEQLRVHQAADDQQLTREELIAAMDRFWAESGAGEICGRCHAQGTGCCPPMCRHLGAEGCLKKNVFCTSFICSALLNAISECDPETGRLLKWMKWNPGAAEFRLYEMVTRVPPIDREQTRPLALPVLYPGLLRLPGAQLREKLLQLADEILEIRRRWNQLERRPFDQTEAN